MLTKVSVVYTACFVAAVIMMGLIFLTPQKHAHRHQTPATQPLLSMNNITLHEWTKDTRYHIIINALMCHVTSLSNDINASKMTCTVFSDNEQIGWLHAHTVNIDRENKHALLNDNVNGNFKDIAFTGHHVTYSFAQNIITCPQATTYTHEHFVIQAQQSTLDITQQCFECGGGVVSEVYLNGPATNNSGN